MCLVCSLFLFFVKNKATILLNTIPDIAIGYSLSIIDCFDIYCLVC